MFNTYTQSTTAVTPGLSPALLALNRQQQSIQESSVTYTQSTVVFDPGVQRLLVLNRVMFDIPAHYFSNSIDDCAQSRSPVLLIRQSCLIHESSVTCLD